MTAAEPEPGPASNQALTEEVSRLPPLAAAPLSVLLPVQEAAPYLTDVVQSWRTFLDGLQRDYELILIDDGSTDGSGALADKLAAECPHLRVLHHPQQRGFGAALRTGLKAARHPLLCYASADQFLQPAQLQRLLDVMDEVELVSGYRAGRPVPLHGRAVGFCWRLFLRILLGLPLDPLPGWLGWKCYGYQKVIRWLFGVRVGDVDSPFKLMRRSILERFPLQSDGHFVHAEILAKANFLGCMMEEVALDEPAVWMSDPQRWRDGLRVFLTPAFHCLRLSGETPVVP